MLNNQIYLYNTLTKRKEKFLPIENRKIRMYVCGVTVYDYCHLGHGRSYVVWDVWKRFFLSQGFDVFHIQNFTDIDDKIIKRSKEEKIDWKELTNKFIDAYFEDMDKLNVLRATLYPKATDYIDDMIKIIIGLIEKGYAYKAGEDIVFSIKKFKDYGKLSGKSIDDLIKNYRVDSSSYKENPLDFVLWKASKPGEPFWESPFGQGRPGWHIECSAMSLKHFGSPFDIHAGGQDLIFPHHENEIAQSEGFTGKKFVNYWLHNGFVTISGEKMSKSLGNFKTLRDIYQEYDPMVLRLFILSSHYRSPVVFNLENLMAAKEAWDKIKNAVDVCSSLGLIGELKVALPNNFIAALCDDLNTPLAISYIFEKVRLINSLVDSYLKSQATDVKSTVSSNISEVLSMIEILGLKYKPDVLFYSKEQLSKEFGSYNSTEVNFESFDELTTENIFKLLSFREFLKKRELYESADKIRDFLNKKGIVIEDLPGGIRVKKR
ncbi:cysteinyl-tRNA synthetase [Thermodesulfobium acidiphilum]|uniref:Cysteine--tRNA ligase n=1 Tax=Thermodesulfobium acidiphilum TaxID=1794699 RepID=A0A2R4VZT5_THEAF|nr:cysteine--tRNA ligase [Thermodesulfobium acidiphilum]AWB10073.1 cysteinyl-tRNA synthetase [Thermodesulfobium acidiphilum]